MSLMPQNLPLIGHVYQLPFFRFQQLLSSNLDIQRRIEIINITGTSYLPTVFFIVHAYPTDHFPILPENHEYNLAYSQNI